MVNNEITTAVRQFLIEEGFKLPDNVQSDTITILTSTSYINIVIWYNPTLSVSVHPAGIVGGSITVDMSHPDSLQQLAAGIRKVMS